jgi:hypothetical protein
MKFYIFKLKVDRNMKKMPRIHPGNALTNPWERDRLMNLPKTHMNTLKAKAKALVTKAKNYFQKHKIKRKNNKIHKEFIKNLKPYVPKPLEANIPNDEQEQDEMDALTHQRKTPLAAGRRYTTPYAMIPSSGPRRTVRESGEIADRNKMMRQLKKRSEENKYDSRPATVRGTWVPKKRGPHAPFGGVPHISTKHHPNQDHLTSSYLRFFQGLKGPHKDREIERMKKEGSFNYQSIELPGGKRANVSPKVTGIPDNPYTNTRAASNRDYATFWPNH